MLQVGDKAPDFELKDENEKVVRLTDLKGKTVVFFFYPKDMTPGCTKEACSFRDGHAALKKKGAVVYGVSRDSAVSHHKFKEKYELPFSLLVDEAAEMIKAYGAWGKRSLYGRSFMGILRSTVVVGPDGKVKAVFPKVKPEEHAKEVLAAL